MPTAAEAELDKVLEEQYRRKLQSDFGLFFRQAWEALNPDTPLVENRYIDAIAEYAQALREGKFTRLIVNQPPRTLKSSIISIAFPCWIWTTEPHVKFIFYTYSFDKLSTPQSVQRRRLILSDWYQTFWGHKFRLSYDENMKWRFSNDRNGHMQVVTGATGTGGNFLIVDDPHSVEEALSDAERQSGVQLFREALMSRLDNPQSDKVCVVMQRLHDSDVTGSLLRDGGWEHLCLPAEAEKRTMVSMPITKKKWIRKVGDLLDPTRLPKHILEQKKTELGSRGYAGQYGQEPAPPSGTIFQTLWWQWYSKPPEFEEVAISVDASFKGKETSDDVAIHKYGMVGINSFLIKRDTRKMGFAATKAAIRAMVNEWPKAYAVLIEDKANGSAIIEELKAEFFVIPINPDFGDKVARAEGCSPMVEAGTVYLPENGDGVKIQTLAAKFPNAEKDDIDALTQFLNWRRKRGAVMKWFEAQAKKVALGQKPELRNPAEGRIEHPDPYEVQRLAMEAAGMKTVRPKLTKPAKAEELKKESPAPDACDVCGGTNFFRSAAGKKCMGCSKVFPKALREVNIG